VRISEPDFSDNTFDCRRDVAIEFCGVGVVGDGWVAGDTDYCQQRWKTHSTYAQQNISINSVSFWINRVRFGFGLY
jgi:hypothetical protein